MLLPRIAYFTNDQMHHMRQKLFDLLGNNGVRMAHPELLKLLKNAGAEVDIDSQGVCFPESFLEEQISKAPKTFELWGRGGKNKLTLPREDGTFYTRTNTGGQSWIEPKSGVYRRVTLSDVAIWGRLTDRLGEIGFCAFPVPSDVPSQTADIHALRTLILNAEKHIWVQPYTPQSIEFLIELSLAASGGKSALRANPPVSFITCSLSPLDFKYMDLDIILRCSRAGIPLHACSLPSCGSTSPITEPGAALLCAAEILAMIATAQVVEPGTPIVATPLIFSTDMATGNCLQASPESLRSASLAVQFIKAAFEIPTHTYGIGSDSPDIDGQCMSEGALRSLMVAMSGADILGAAGQIEVATTISPVQLVIDNEVFGMVRRLMTSMDFDDEAMAWEDLLNTKPGAEFLTSSHTLGHCRDALRPINFTRLNRESWESDGKKGLIDRATDFSQNLIINSEPASIDNHIIKEMDSIVGKADKYLT